MIETFHRNPVEHGLVQRHDRRGLKALVMTPLTGLAMAIALLAQSNTLMADTLPGVTDDELRMVQAVETARTQVIQKVMGSVVAVYGKSRGGGGSGVIFHPEGYALTNFHVTNGAGASSPKETPHGRAGLADGKLYPWRLIGMDPGGDLAIIQLVKPKGMKAFPYSKLGDSDDVRVGDFVMAMGNPFVLTEDLKPTVTLGIVSGIKRFQPGTGPTKKMLEYGNCIQIDSSINPGNSGGPLFNMQGEVIGINGRGSFEERGRVNVGVGYAISANQCKTFIPDLLATKVAQHGTLDATFGYRGGKVVCTAVNMQSKIAKQGLELSDQLVRFDGHVITNGNQFTNLIATLPAGWPVEVVINRNGKEFTFWQRLDAIPVPMKAKPAPRVAPPKPKEDKDTPLPSDGGKPKNLPDVAPKPKPAPKPKVVVAKPPKAGVPLNIKRNRVEAERVIESWNLYKRLGRSVKDQSPQTPWAPDTFTGDELVTFADPTNQIDPVSCKRLILQGSGKAQGVPAYRLLAELESGKSYVLWLSVLDQEQDDFEVRLLKAAPADKDGNATEEAMVYRDYRLHSQYMVPDTFARVRGLAEVPVRQVPVPLNAVDRQEK